MPPTDLYQQRRLLESLGFGFVEQPLPAEVAQAPAQPARAAAPAASRPPAQPRPAAPRTPAAPAAPAPPPTATLDAIAAAIAKCARCSLELTRHHAIPGGGNANAPLMIIIEAPSPDDDRTGQAAAGELGELLDNILKAMKTNRQEVFIAHAVRCAPPSARSPRPEEITACAPYLARQIQLIRPRVILAFGLAGLTSLLPQTNAPIANLRGQWHQFQGIPLMATFSLPYMHRSKDQKRKVWEDLQAVMARLASTSNMA